MGGCWCGALPCWCGAPDDELRLTAADLPDVACTGCGHPRGTDCGCSCTGPGTCGGGTDDVEGGA